MSLTQELIALIRAKPVTDEDLEQAALLTLDALACAYAGSNTPVGEILGRWAAQGDMDSRRQALLMAALTHITETDDLHRASVTHPGCVVVPAVLSLGEKLGSNNHQMLAAILQGFEAMCRIGAAVGPAHYRIWHNTATCGPFGSAMATASLLQLDAAQTLDALGNAGTQASGFWQFMESGAMSKHLHAGRACESGWLAADLAASGLHRPGANSGRPQGIFCRHVRRPRARTHARRSRAHWQLRLTSIKPWPSCRHTHPVIDCALEIHELLDGQAVERIEIKTYQAALDVCDNPAPESEYQAKFSLYHTAAIALLDGAVGLESFTAQARQRSETCARSRGDGRRSLRVQLSRFLGRRSDRDRCSGARFKVSRRDCKGDPELALTNAEMRSKALGLLRYGELEDEAADRICDSVLAMPTSTEPTRPVFRFHYPFPEVTQRHSRAR